jgi:hypothetical protein
VINLHVEIVDALIAQLQAKGVEILGRQEEEYGQFAWILDCDGLKLELGNRQASGALVVSRLLESLPN